MLAVKSLPSKWKAGDGSVATAGRKAGMDIVRYFVGINDTKIAAMYGISRRTVNHHKHRALKRLRQEMKRLAYEET